MSAFVRYNLALLVFALLMLSAGGAVLLMLDRTGRLPPPPLTATSCIDEKFKFLHESPVRDPSLIAVGSSVTWRNLDLSVLERSRSGARALNAAPCYLMVGEIAFLTRFYLDNMPSVQVVLTVFAMRDFEACSGDEAFFDVNDARRYVIDRKPAWHLYFLNLRLYSFLKDVMRIKEMRTSTVEAPLFMDYYGSGPLTGRPPRVYGDMRPTGSCLDRLARMARELDARKVRWIVALLPPMPAWLEKYDPDGERDRAWREEVAEALRGTGAMLMDGRYGPPMQDRNFTDPVHLHWDSVPTFTQWLINQMTEQAALTPLSLETADAL